MSEDDEYLDEIDKKIIQLLQENSRITLVDIAKDIGQLTENAIRYRIDKLESEGFISDYTIKLDPKKFGKETMAMIELNVLPENTNETLDTLKSKKFLTDVYLTTGNFPIMVIGRFKNNNDITKFITNHLKKVKIVDYKVSTVLEIIKHELFEI